MREVGGRGRKEGQDRPLGRWLWHTGRHNVAITIRSHPLPPPDARSKSRRPSPTEARTAPAVHALMAASGLSASELLQRAVLREIEVGGLDRAEAVAAGPDGADPTRLTVRLPAYVR